MNSNISGNSDYKYLLSKFKFKLIMYTFSKNPKKMGVTMSSNNLLMKRKLLGKRINRTSERKAVAVAESPMTENLKDLLDAEPISTFSPTTV